jgi:hypothetical protein
LQNLRFVAAAASGPQHLVMPKRVEANQTVGEREDRFGRAIVLFEPNYLGVGPVGFEPQNMRDLGPAPAIDRLIVVAHDA